MGGVWIWVWTLAFIMVMLPRGSHSIKCYVCSTIQDDDCRHESIVTKEGAKKGWEVDCNKKAEYFQTIYGNSSSDKGPLPWTNGTIKGSSAGWLMKTGDNKLVWNATASANTTPTMEHFSKPFDVCRRIETILTGEGERPFVVRTCGTFDKSLKNENPVDDLEKCKEYRSGTSGGAVIMNVCTCNDKKGLCNKEDGQRMLAASGILVILMSASLILGFTA